jgi:chemotaxis signal transduction protein
MNTIASVNLAERYLMTQVGTLQLVFAAAQVTEIIRVEKSKILGFPFYSTLILGIVNHNGSLLPLVSGHTLLQQEKSTAQELITAIRLRYANSDIAIIVDRALGSTNKKQLPPKLFGDKGQDGDLILMNPQLLPPETWLPQQ